MEIYGKTMENIENMQKWKTYGKYGKHMKHARENTENGKFGGISSKHLPPTSVKRKASGSSVFHIFPIFFLYNYLSYTSLWPMLASQTQPQTTKL